MFFMLLTVAGNETTRNAITHGMLAFLEHRDQWDRLAPSTPRCSTSRPRRSCAGRARSSTSGARSRTTPSSRGQQLKAGDKITIWYPSANRDEDVFERPFDFDIGRDPNPHIGFGGRRPALLPRLEPRPARDQGDLSTS